MSRTKTPTYNMMKTIEKSLDDYKMGIIMRKTAVENILKAYYIYNKRLETKLDEVLNE